MGSRCFATLEWHEVSGRATGLLIVADSTSPRERILKTVRDQFSSIDATAMETDPEMLGLWLEILEEERQAPLEQIGRQMEREKVRFKTVVDMFVRGLGSTEACPLRSFSIKDTIT
jgi:hypothetical protein